MKRITALTLFLTITFFTACSTVSKAPNYIGTWSGINERLQREVGVIVLENGNCIFKDSKRNRTQSAQWEIDENNNLVFFRLKDGKKDIGASAFLAKGGSELVMTKISNGEATVLKKIKL